MQVSKKNFTPFKKNLEKQDISTGASSDFSSSFIISTDDFIYLYTMFPNLN